MPVAFSDLTRQQITVHYDDVVAVYACREKDMQVFQNWWNSHDPYTDACLSLALPGA